MRAYLVSDTQVTQKRVLIGVVCVTWSTDATATRWLNEVETRAKL